MRHILSIDGGGIRGIVPCCALVELERQTGKLTREVFQMAAGTSTGALLAAAVAVGIPAADILPIYTERAPREIFTGSLSKERMLALGYRYESENIAKVLRSAFGASANWTLNASPIRLLLTAVHVSKTPMYFTQDTPRNGKLTGGLSLVDCATASAAAPTYFNPWYVSPLPAGSVGPFGNELIGRCFDGGVGVLANPVHQACVEAFYKDDFDLEDTRVISLGTGSYAAPLVVDEPHGLLAEAGWTIDSLLAAAHAEQLALMDLYYPGVMRRVDVALPRAIDEADMSAIPALVELGQSHASSLDWKALLQ